APASPIQNGPANVRLSRQEPGLVDRRQATVQGLACGRHLVVVLIVREIDELAPGHVAPRVLADFPALGEQVLLPRRQSKLRSLGIVTRTAQLLMDMAPGEIARLGEVRGFERHTSTVMDNSLPDGDFAFPVSSHA